MYERVLALLEELKVREPWVVERREGMGVYRRGEKIFLVVREGSDPLRLDVGVGKELSRLLSSEYESVMASKVMDAATWVEVICTGQLGEDEVLDLVRASWERAGGQS
jgi:predicted DNA-binding protein (MmcQ/YjbR family)